MSHMLKRSAKETAFPAYQRAKQLWAFVEEERNLSEKIHVPLQCVVSNSHKGVN